MGYRLYWHLPSLFNAANFFGNREDAFPRVVSMNLVCIPGEQNTAVKDAREVRDNADRPIE